MLPNFDWAAIVTAQQRQLDFLETLADGAPLSVNGMPWRQAFYRLNKIVSDPIPWHWLSDEPARRARRKKVA